MALYLVPHMSSFVPCRSVKLIEDDPPSKCMHFLPRLEGGYPSRHGDGNGDGNSDGNGDDNDNGDDNGDNNQTTIN